MFSIQLIIINEIGLISGGHVIPAMYFFSLPVTLMLFKI